MGGDALAADHARDSIRRESSGVEHSSVGPRPALSERASWSRRQALPGSALWDSSRLRRPAARAAVTATATRCPGPLAAPTAAPSTDTARRTAHISLPPDGAALSAMLIPPPRAGTAARAIGISSRTTPTVARSTTMPFALSTNHPGPKGGYGVTGRGRWCSLRRRRSLASLVHSGTWQTWRRARSAGAPCGG